jgi:CHAD domain-containing protein
MDTAGSRIWATYEHVRAYDSVVAHADVETLHELRIAGKRLRYTLEFLREPLGSDVAPLIERVVALQDHLGWLHDAEVAGSSARGFLAQHGSDLDRAQAEAIRAYRASREAEVDRLRRTVGGPWRNVAGPAFRRSLAKVLGSL